MTINSKSFPAYFALFKVTFRQMFWSRRTVLILLGCLLPIVIALVFRFVARSGGMVNRFVPQVTLILYGLLVDLCAIFYGTAIISDEIDSKGLTYLQMRPLRKSVNSAQQVRGVHPWHCCPHCHIALDSNRHYGDTPKTRKERVLSVWDEPALHGNNDVGVVGLRRTRSGFSSEV